MVLCSLLAIQKHYRIAQQIVRVGVKFTSQQFLIIDSNEDNSEQINYLHSIIIKFLYFPSMQSSSSSSSSSSESQSASKKEDNKLKQKFITFRSPGETKQIIAKIPIPRYIYLSRTEVHDLQALRNKLKMLYIDVLCRGYHPIKSFEAEAKNVFKQIENSHKLPQKNVRITRLCNNEAVGTIWRCLAREIGRPLKSYSIQEVEAQLFDELNLMRQRAEKHSREKRQKVINLQDLTNIEDKIKQQFQRIRQKQSKRSSENYSGIFAAVLEEQILSLERQVFVRSIVGIRQWDQNTELVQIILEQCYPSIQMSKQRAMSVLGESIFKEKWEFYENYREKCGLDAESELIFCHRCLTPLNSYERLGTCSGDCASLQVGYTLLTDPYMYNRAVINENCTPRATSNFMHPYLIYYSAANDEGGAICNRYFCNKCEGMEASLSTTGNCGFCQGLCDCFRCQNMDLLTKMMAVYIETHCDLKLLISKFLMKFHSKYLKMKKKKRFGKQPDRREEFQHYLELFLKQNIFVRRQNKEKYEQIKYFKEKGSEEPEKGHKNKMTRVQLQQGRTDRQDRLRKQRQVNAEIKRLNDIISGGRSKQRESLQKQEMVVQMDVFMDDSDS